MCSGHLQNKCSHEPKRLMAWNADGSKARPRRSRLCVKVSCTPPSIQPDPLWVPVSCLFGLSTRMKSISVVLIGIKRISRVLIVFVVLAWENSQNVSVTIADPCRVIIIAARETKTCFTTCLQIPTSVTPCYYIFPNLKLGF